MLRAHAGRPGSSSSVRDAPSGDGINTSRRGIRRVLPEAGSAEGRPEKSGRRKRVRLWGSIPTQCGTPTTSCRTTAGGPSPAGTMRPASSRGAASSTAPLPKTPFPCLETQFLCAENRHPSLPAAAAGPARTKSRAGAGAGARPPRKSSRSSASRTASRARAARRPTASWGGSAGSCGASCRSSWRPPAASRRRRPRRGRCAHGRAALHVQAARSGGEVRGPAQRRPAGRAARQVEAGDPRPGPREKDALAGCRRARRRAGRTAPDVRAARRRDGRAAGRGRRRRPKAAILPARPPRPATPILAPPGPPMAPRAGSPNPRRGESCQGVRGGGGMLISAQHKTEPSARPAAPLRGRESR